MKHVEYSWKASDGLEMFAQSWAPDGTPKAVVALVHGVGEHSGRYPLLVERLPAAGYALSAFDVRGHGRTAGPRLYAPSYEVLMGDIDKHIEQTRLRFPRMSLFLYGHSLGGIQVLYFALRRAPQVAGVIASSPGLGSGTPVPAMKLAAVKIISRLAPTMIFTTGFPWEGLSRDPALIERTRKDPLFREGMSARLAAETLRVGAWVSSQTQFPFPLLLMQGTDDHHVDPEKTIAFGKGLSGDVTLKVWEAGRHELHNDLDREKVADFVLAWMEKHRGQ